MTESAVVAGIRSANALGVIRGLARQGIPVILLDMDRHSMVRFSRFVSQRIPCPHPQDSPEGFIDCLVTLGKRQDHRPMIVPTSDAEILTLSRYRETLDPYFRIPCASYETVDLLLNKKRFFQELIRRSIPCARSYFPISSEEARAAAAEIGFPFLVKAAYSHEFIRCFHKKVFVVHSQPEFETAMTLLSASRLDYFLQEIIPGKTLFLLYAYFNRRSEPLGACGYEKVHQFPKDFGVGTVCRSRLIQEPIRQALRLLGELGYHGLAEPEFKLDPRDGGYKLIEINPRSVSQTRLAEICGVHAEFQAFSDLVWGAAVPAETVREGVVWIDEINELHRQLAAVRRGRFCWSELSFLRSKPKVFAWWALDDPLPLIVGLALFFYGRLRGPRTVDPMLAV